MVRSWIEFNLNRIIKILGIDGINRHDGMLGVIDPAIEILLGKIFCDMVGFIEYIRREDIRQVVGSDDG